MEKYWPGKRKDRQGYELTGKMTRTTFDKMSACSTLNHWDRHVKNIVSEEENGEEQLLHGQMNVRSIKKTKKNNIGMNLRTCSLEDIDIIILI